MALEKPPSSIVTSANYQALETDSPWFSHQQDIGIVFIGEHELSLHNLFSSSFLDINQLFTA